jgi:type VI secretion system protein ImpM
MENVETNASAYSIELAWGGKIPSVGDFVWSDGYTPLRAQLDKWLMTAMQQFRLSDGWKSSFDQAPMWNFIVPANVFGSACVAGCISPSCDRIGRRFPFAVTYGLSPRAPEEYLSKVMDAMPGLLSQTGFLLFNGIRRQWPRETLATLIYQALTNWKEAQLPVEQIGLGTPHIQSVILDVLEVESNNSTNTVSSLKTPSPEDISKENNISSDKSSQTVPDRFSSLPWNNIASSLSANLDTSFWWTNGAGGAALKTFTYRSHLDGVLMTWLFGHSSI